MIVLGLDPGTRRLGVALIDAETGRLRAHFAVEFPPDRVNRVAAVYDQAQLVVSRDTVVAIEEPPLVHRNVDTLRKLCEVVGAFRAGCAHARWVRDFTQAEWKLASVGKGTASKAEYVAWARATYAVQTMDDDICAAIGIAHAGREWWNSQRKEGAA